MSLSRRSRWSSRACNREIALPCTVSLRMMKVTDFKTPARIFANTLRLRVVTAVNYDHFRNANSLFCKAVETTSQHFRSANCRDDRRDIHATRFIQKLEARVSLDQ